MQAIATTIPGIEEITQLELKEILKVRSEKVISSKVKFDIKDEKSLIKFIRSTRSSLKVYKIIEQIKFINLENLLVQINKINFPKIKSPFVVRCEREGDHDFASIDIEKQVGEIILNHNKLKVDLHNPKTTILVDILDENCFIGIDFTGIKLSKRDYRIRLSRNPLNPCLAYAMLRIADIKIKDTILDPFCKSGEIPIEVALYLLNIPPNKKNEMLFVKSTEATPKIKTKNSKLKIIAIDDSQNNLKSAQINAKIASINKNINFSRSDIQWLDTKFKKGSIDKIITFPPYPTNNMPIKKLERLYKEFFHQAEFILKSNGNITLLTNQPDLIAEYSKHYKFKKTKQIQTTHMKHPFCIVQLTL